MLTPLYEQNLEKIGQIIESGSNTHGSYIKFADGTMICYSQGVAGYYDSASKVYVSDWTFPIAFIDKPVVIGNTLGGNSKTYSSIFGVFVTHVVIQTKCFGINGAVEECDRGANCIAIGRWR